MTLASPQAKAGNFASQVVAAIAAVELPEAQWNDLIEVLLGFVNNQSNTNLKVATLQTIGFICEAIVSFCAPPVFFPRAYDPSVFIVLETRDLEFAGERDFDCCYPWCAERGALDGCSARCDPRPLQLA